MSSLDLDRSAPHPPSREDEDSAATPRDTGGRLYWRSLDRLLDSPAVQEQLAREAASEFPAGASDAPDQVSRRTMLGIMGASFAMAGLPGCRRPVETIVPFVEGPETMVPGVPRRYATTMPLGSNAYGLVVESQDGRPTKIEGNEQHPSSQGAASTWMQASVLGLYDPDRSGTPRHRASGGAESESAGEAEGGHGEAEGGHGEERAAGGGGAEPSTWEDFLAFVQELGTELDATEGAGLALLTTAHSSPTQARLEAEMAVRWPRSRRVAYESLGDANLFRGCEAAVGSPCRPVYHFEKARVVLSLDADFLNHDGESLANTRGFARGRRVEGPSDEMNRLYVAEGSLSLTGAAADHRLRVPSRQIAGLAAAVASQLGVSTPAGFDAADLPSGAGSKIALIAEDLRSAGAGALVVAGRQQPPAVHALALEMNRVLGSLGSTVTLHEMSDTAYGDAGDLAELVGEIRGGEISTLVILGGNPVYSAPGDLELGSALGQVENVVHLGLGIDETSSAAGWQLPEAHFLEAWGDARSADGTLSVVQPLIAPLLDGRSAIEVLAMLVRGAEVSGHDLVEETWAPVLGEGGDKAWRRVLHDGLMADSKAPEVAVGGALQIPALEGVSAEGFEICFLPSSATYDGRFANNAWLQELPDSITKLTWDNAVLVSPATAVELGLRSRSGQGDRVRLTYREKTLEAVAFALPGLADRTIGLVLGYGRSAAGRVGTGVGFDVGALRSSAAPYFDGGLQVEKAAGTYPLSQTQEHWEMEGRPIVREATLAEYRSGHDDLDRVFGTFRNLDPEKSHQPFGDFDYSESPQWGMAIDLNACTGCSACIVACQSENNIPIVGKEQVARGREMHWLRVDRYFSSVDSEVPDDPEVVFQPVPCMHCENAPCEQVCPVAATVHDRHGINAMVYNRCIGTRYCSNNCPYKVRRFNFFNYTKDTPELVKMAMNPDVTVRSRGVMEKCTFCLQRTSEARIAAKKEGRAVADGDVKTACQQTCPADAIAFGDIRDESSEVTRWKKQDRDYVLLAELNNRPRTSYLAKLRNPHPRWSPESAMDGGAGGGDHA